MKQYSIFKKIILFISLSSFAFILACINDRISCCDMVYAASSDKALDGYMDLMLKASDGTEAYGSYNVGQKLKGQNKIIYNELKKQITEIAAGKRESSNIAISVSKILKKTNFTPEDLNIEYIYKSGFHPQLSECIEKLFTFNNEDIVNALLADCPYEMYWFDKSKGYSYTRRPSASVIGNELVFSEENTISFSFCVDENYRSISQYDIDTSKIKSVNKAIKNINKIVDAAKNKSDYEKLVYYKQQICKLTSYNHDAAKKSAYELGTIAPWQLIYVFDGNDKTNVVCEGYAKAFAYLCDLTKFKSDKVYAYTVTGVMYDASGKSGGHMWNIVHMDDDKNYLVDITNCDS